MTVAASATGTGAKAAAKVAKSEGVGRAVEATAAKARTGRAAKAMMAAKTSTAAKANVESTAATVGETEVATEATVTPKEARLCKRGCLHHQWLRPCLPAV